MLCPACGTVAVRSMQRCAEPAISPLPPSPLVLSDSDEDMTLGELVAAAGHGPRSPTVKVEQSALPATWATLDELDGAIGGGAAAAVADRSSRKRGGQGVPKRCSRCSELKKGGCACVKNKATGK